MKGLTAPRIIILGAGFGGLWAVRSLAHTRSAVVLIDRNNFHTFLPLLYQVGAAELAPEDIAYPVRSILRKLPNVDFRLGDVQRIDFSSRTVEMNGTSAGYDYLILAAGSVAHYFDVPGASEHAYPLKTLEHGVALRNQILSSLERALYEPDPARRRSLLTFAIVGGGPTGVEFAGALSELIRRPLVRDFPQLNFREVRVVLLEALQNLLSGMPEKLSSYARDRLVRMGVELHLGVSVSEVTPRQVRLNDGTVIPSETVIWTAGVRGEPGAQAWGLPTTKNGCVSVLPTLQVPDHPEVYVIGDLAHIHDHPLPMIAPVAMQQGTRAAENILRQIKAEEPLPFHYRDRGTMATIGRNAAVAHLAGRAVSGFAAWIIWLSVHLAKLIGFRNRLLVLINWAWDYLFYERAVRLILPGRPVDSSNSI
jgi:NADH dehydrogenase